MNLSSLLLVAVGSVLLTLAVVFVATNVSGAERRIRWQLPRLYETDDREFRRALGSLLGPPLVAGNRVTPLCNGDAIFPAMLEAIRSASETVTFETFIYWSGQIGGAFADALSERAEAGVRVHVLLDWVGTRQMDDRLLAQLKTAGVEVRRFHRPSWRHITRLNNRTHRKLLITDGAVGFTGGVGIADQWRGDARNPEEWRDSHFRVEGPVVAQMQAVFLDNWMRATGKVLHGPTYFPPLRAAGDIDAQMFSSSPNGGGDSMHLMYLLALTAAHSTIDISASYFVPDRLTIDTLIDAAGRGVIVRVLLPSHHMDSIFVRKASRALWGPLLEAGIVLAEYQPTMLHKKCLVVDARFVSVGSTNFDNRSFRLNDEANLNVIDEAFARTMQAEFEADWQNAKPVSLAAWQQRPLRTRMRERVSMLLRSQL